MSRYNEFEEVNGQETVNIGIVGTVSGRKVSIQNPDPETISIYDIAHGLSNTCRFSGQSKVNYNVAQHSILVSLLCPEEYALMGLLHDATEAYMSDVATPLKKMLPTYQALEKGLENCIFRAFDLPTNGMPAGIKQADLEALAVEAAILVDGGGKDWYPLVVNDIHAENVKYQLSYEGIMGHEEAKAAFLERFYELTE